MRAAWSWLAAAGMASGWALAAALHERRTYYRGKTVLITGGSRGLGLALARELSAQGANLTLVARDPAELEAVRKELNCGSRCHTVIADARKEEQIAYAVNAAVQQFGQLDILINNAGMISVAPFDNFTNQDFEDALAIHLWAPLFAIRAALPHFRAQGSGQIVNIASVGGKIGLPHLVPYCASKFALVGLSDALRTELRRENIYVTTICPGLMRTGSHEHAIFKGDHRGEYRWFAISDASPLLSTSVDSAARQVLSATRKRLAYATVTLRARLAIIGNELFPELSTVTQALVHNLIMPKAQPGGEKVYKAGYESHSRWAPSLLTRLADREVPRMNQ